MTSAGTAAGIDLCLHIVACDHGADVAATVARRMVMPLYRTGGQAQYVDTPIAPREHATRWPSCSSGGSRTRRAALSVDDLARRAAMSPRTLTRRFRAAAGVPPGEWLQRERLRLAQRLLESTDEPIERVARSAGYDTSDDDARAVRARLQTSPRAYRRTFRSGV